MPGNPVDWSVAILGAWNLAILTPAGIARRLFQLPPAHSVEVLLPLEGRGPVRVSYDSLTVVPSETSLVIAPLAPTRASLASAASLATRALQSLPETPLTAVGVNIRYAFDAMPTELLRLTVCPLDDCLANLNHRVPKKTLRRSIAWQPGELNLDILEAENASGILAFNFHLPSTTPSELLGWLTRTEEMVAAAQTLLTATTTSDTEGHPNV